LTDSLPILCNSGYTNNGTGCVPISIVSSQCPTGYNSDGLGNCLPPIVVCASGFSSDGQGNCLPVDTLSPPTVNVCPTGYVSDGLGNCVSPVYPLICASGYTLDTDGSCVSVLPPTCGSNA
jgi:hypothetical protein